MSSPKPRVLAVDDETDILLLLKTALSDDYEVSTASSGEDALEHAQDTEFDLFILDMMMPGMDGFETLEKLRENSKSATTPVIFLTGVSDKDKIRKALDMGTAYYIVKPFDYTELMEKASLAIRDARA